jgi:DNA-binding GntR family transcriptional regulator
VNAGYTSERVYEALRARIIEHGFRPGARLDPALIADGLASSVTPVRDALHRLVGEGLVETAVSEGFHVPQVNLPALQDLYGWSRQLVRLAIRSWSAAPSALFEPQQDAGLARRLTAVLAATVARSSNQEHHRAILSVNDRLFAARVVEVGLLPDGEAEVAAIEIAAQDGNALALRSASDRYQDRRLRAAAEIVRLLYRIP